MNELRPGKDATIISSKAMAERSMEAAEKLAQAKIEVRVISSSSKATDNDLIINAAIETGALVTVEEENELFQIRDMVIEILREFKALPMMHISVINPGAGMALDTKLDEYSSSIQDISYTVKRVLAKKIARGMIGIAEK